MWWEEEAVANVRMYLQSTLTLIRLLTDGGTELVAMHR